VDRPTRTILLALSALLLPCVAVGWFGVVQIGKVEEVLASSFQKEAEQVLRETAEEVQSAVEDFVRTACGRVDGETLEAMVASVQKLAQSERGVDHAFLLDDRLELLHPRTPPLTSTVLPTSLRSRMFRIPRDMNLGDHPEMARVLEALGDFEGAVLEHDEMLRLLSQRFGGAEILMAWWVRFSKAALLARMGRTDNAAQELELVLDSLDQRREFNRENTDELRLDCLYLRPRMELPDRPQGAVDDLLALGTAVAWGEYDGVPDEILNQTLSRIGRQIESADRSPETQATWQAIQSEDAVRVEGRVFATDFSMFGSPKLALARRTDEGADLLCVDWNPGGEPSLVGAVRRLGPDEDIKHVWAGVQVDLRGLLLERFYRRLQGEDAAFRFEIYAPPGETRLGLSPETPATPIEAQRLLRKPLQGFTLRVFARDPAAFHARARNLLYGKYALAMGLGAVALLGAGFLLRAVRREAELSRLKLDFVSRVSHELRTPLALIRMYADTLAMGRVHAMDKAVDFGGIIAKEADRLTHLIDNVLDFSRIEAGRKVYSPRPTDLPALLRSLADAYRPHLEKKGFTLHVLAAPLPPLLVDHEGMTQCFVNLVDNAVKYTDHGDKRIEIEALARDGRVRIEFRDRGIGIPTAERERVFDTFYRATTAGERPGAGLGLAIVRHFAQAHRGTVSADPRPGGGSVFALELPFTFPMTEPNMENHA
jgi:signal transduction histidine kinase